MKMSKAKKAKLLKEIQAGLKEVKLIRDGKLKPLTMEDLLKFSSKPYSH